MENRKFNQNVIELRGLSETLKKQNIRVGDISKELYENNILTQELRKEVADFKKLLKQNNKNQQEINELRNQLLFQTQEINNLKNRIIDEKKSKLNVQEELYEMYEREERLLKAHRKLVLKHQALSNSKLGKLTYVYWGFLKRLKRGKENGNS